MCILFSFCPTFLFLLFSIFRLILITHTSTRIFVLAETNKMDMTQYVLMLEQMIENDYLILSYMADVFKKPAGWVETLQPAEKS